MGAGAALAVEVVHPGTAGTWAALVVGLLGAAAAAVTALVLRMAMRSLARQHARDMARVIGHMDEMRAKQSRHEYIQESVLRRVEAVVADVRAEVEAVGAARRGRAGPALQFGEGDGPRVLFVTSNGAGLGHAARCLAVAQAGRGVVRPSMLTMSAAHEAMAGCGIPVRYVPSQLATGQSSAEWNRRFAIFMHGLLEADRPDLVVFDGTWVYRGLTEAARANSVPLVWLRRGAWKPDAPRTQFDEPSTCCDAVVVPGDMVPGDDPRPGELHVAPISMFGPDALGADGARRALGLDPGRRYALVQVGAGTINDVGGLRRRAVDAVRRYGGDVEPVLVSSVLRPDASGGPATAPVTGTVTVVSGVFPLARYLRAFDMAITAAGYNSVHENVAALVPTVFVPNGSTITDDQAARARAAADLGVGLLARDDELDDAVAHLAQEANRRAMRAAMAALPAATGAAEVARLLERLAVEMPGRLRP